MTDTDKRYIRQLDALRYAWTMGYSETTEHPTAPYWAAKTRITELNEKNPYEQCIYHTDNMQDQWIASDTLVALDTRR